MPDLPLHEYQRKVLNGKAIRQKADGLAAEREEADPDPKPNRKSLRRAAEWFPPKPGEPGT